MNFGQILKRSWHMVWTYRALWIFGIVLGLVTFSWGWTLLSRDDDGQRRQGIAITRLDGESFRDALERTLQRELDGVEEEMSVAQRELERFFRTEVGREFAVDAATVLLIVAAAFVAAVIVSKFARYVTEAALIRMVGHYEDTGERLSVRQGLRLGASRTAWRLFLIDLVIDIPVILALVVLFALAFAPLVLGIMSDTTTTVITGSLLSAGLFAAGIALAIVTGALLSLLKRFFRQACALESLGVLASMRRGWAVVRQNPVEVLVMWLIMVGIGLGWAIAVALSFVVLFPLLLLFIALGGLAGALPAYLVYLLSSLVFEGAVPVLLAVVVGLPIFVVVMLIPWWFAGGLMQVFESSVWTLAYRELRPLGEAEAAPVRAVDLRGAGAVAAT